MKTLFRKLIIVLVCIMPFAVVAQEAHSKDKAPASTRAQRKAAKQKWKEQRRAEMEQKKAVKEHAKHLQSKQTLKQMKRDKRKSEKLKTNKREFFLIRWFKYKH